MKTKEWYRKGMTALCMVGLSMTIAGCSGYQKTDADAETSQETDIEEETSKTTESKDKSEADENDADADEIKEAADELLSDALNKEETKTPDLTNATKITLSDQNIDVSGEGVEVSDNEISIVKGGSYLITGTLSDGNVVVNAPDEEVILVLDQAEITSSDTSALYVYKSEETTVYLAEGSTNTLTDAAEYSYDGEYASEDDDEPNACVYSKSDLVIAGKGTLTVKANYKNGITGKDDLVIENATLFVDAVNHGVTGKDNCIVKNADLTITSTKDALRSTNDSDEEKGNIVVTGSSLKIDSDEDGIQAENILVMNESTCDVKTGDGGTVTKKAGNMAMGAPGADRMRPDDSGNDQNGADDSQSQSNMGDNQKNMGGNQPDNSQNNTGDNQNDLGGNQPDNSGNNQNSTDTSQKNIDKNQNNTGNDEKNTDENENTTSDSQDDTSMKGIKGIQGIVVYNGTYQFDCEDDAIHSNGVVIIEDGSYEIATGDDAIHADDAVVVEDGNIEISECYEGIEGKTVDIHGGTINITSEDDGINAADGSSSAEGGQAPFQATEGCYIQISGGVINIDADGDGVDSNGDLYVSGGELYISGPENDGNSALDYDGSASISGGIVVAAGYSGMAQNFGSDSTQGSILVTFDTALTDTSSMEIILTDESGQTLLSYTPAKSYKCVVLSCPELAAGNTYTVSAGDQSTEVTMDSLIYGETKGMGGTGGMGKPGDDMGAPDGTDRPELPEGMEPPEGMEKPDGMEPPDGTERPEKPDGTAPSEKTDQNTDNKQ